MLLEAQSQVSYISSLLYPCNISHTRSPRKGNLLSEVTNRCCDKANIPNQGLDSDGEPLRGETQRCLEERETDAANTAEDGMRMCLCEFSGLEWTKSAVRRAFKREGFVEEAGVRVKGTALRSLWTLRVNLAKFISLLCESAAQLENWAQHRSLLLKTSSLVTEPGFVPGKEIATT